MITQQQYVAMTRFGLGPSFKDLQALGDSPNDWLLSQIEPTVQDHGPQVPSSRRSLVERKAIFDEIRKLKRAGSGSGGISKSSDQQIKQLRRQARKITEQQLLQRFSYAQTTNTPFRERLVQFYSNHFTVSCKGKNAISTACVGYENEAIRSRLNGHFGGMLNAVVKHPVMLTYLDNIRSIGPNSSAGKKRKVGPNENLAREILELHTLGVDGGYHQRDVIALANIITGWTVGGKRLAKFGAEPGAFFFSQRMHEPGAHRLMGKDYLQEDVQQGQSALQDLSLHPSTARFVATKLARHFIADEPPEEAINLLTQTYLDTDGHLPTLHRALIEMDLIWQPSHRKFKTPYEYVLSILRVLPVSIADKRLSRSLSSGLESMGQVPFSASSPKGWPDTATHWTAPDALKKRIEWALAIGLNSGIDPVFANQTIEKLLPPDSDTLRVAMSRAESPSQAIALLFASPDFQWR
ncbi:DUF1800 domain-containing protein [Pontibacterium sp. N1Y112]|uniref:DUF1800 domain-containing protein n=1 Tax=Pontibacterium sinense TaxID=2781979 RepID=A0A8J7K515_9GAMM|nr:DUF1800 domain-containing protein [Pontibacterium sinense]